VVELPPEAPVVIRRFLFPQEDVQVVVAEDALRQVGIHKPLDYTDDGGAIGTTVGEVAKEDQPPALGVSVVFSVAEPSHQVVEGLDLTVDVSNDIYGAVEQRANKGRGH
jgi:hypothetical protein